MRGRATHTPAPPDFGRERAANERADDRAKAVCKQEEEIGRIRSARLVLALLVAYHGQRGTQPLRHLNSQAAPIALVNSGCSLTGKIDAEITSTEMKIPAYPDPCTALPRMNTLLDVATAEMSVPSSNSPSARRRTRSFGNLVRSRPKRGWRQQEVRR